MTKCMTREERLGFMESLEGEWVGANKRRKVVNADVLVNIFPIGWKIEISIRRRADLITFYCRNYVSPAGLEFKTCTEVASYIRARSLIDVVEMGEINNGSRIPLKESKKLPGKDGLYDVNIASFIDCYRCGLKFEDIRGLEKHLACFHKKITRRLNLPTRETTRLHSLQSLDPEKDPCQRAVMDRDEPQSVQNGTQQNGQASSISQVTAEAQESDPVVNGNGRFLTTCTWCYKEFLCGPVDAETMAEAAGYMCPKCKKKACGVFETLNGV
ncbi:uncharacterized protein [Rutidosis leptorrhynchoides]|uniref:uncharacterized protein n=1 Tax=Rutidosis leptorrhynchoides TaxID=125765 RepID=UPI003A99D62E